MTARPEDLIHRSVVVELEARKAPGVVYWHTANQGKRSGRSTNALKSLGMRPGVSDLVFLHRGKFYALELKAPGGKPPSEAQLDFIGDVNSAGGFTCVAEGLAEALKALEMWEILRPDRSAERRAA